MPTVASEPDVSVIVPVLHEAGRIRACLEAAARTMPGAEIVVVDGSAAGDTIHAIETEEVVALTAPSGRGRQMNAGAARASGDVLLFLHADTRLPEGAMGAVRRALADPEVVGGAFGLAIEPAGDGPRGAALRLIAWMAGVRARLCGLPFGDQAIFLRREYFRELGGYADIPLMEDMELMRRIRRRGGRIAILQEKVSTSARRWEREGVVRCTVRNWTLQALFLLGVKARRLARLYPPEGHGRADNAGGKA